MSNSSSRLQFPTRVPKSHAWRHSNQQPNILWPDFNPLIKLTIAYLICAHKNPILIKRTVECLSCEGVSFFVHIDAKFAINPFEIIRGKNVFFTDKRIPVYWGEFSQTEAILLLIRQALAAPQHHDYFVLLGGSEFPLRSGQYIQHFLEVNRGGEFITLVKIPAPGKPISRINTLRYPSTRPILRFVFRALAKAGLAERDYRKHLGNLEPFSGNTWWALSREACEHIIEFTQRNRILAKFLENTQSSDESFFHTILGNSPFKSRLRRNLLFEDWSAHGPHPEMINEQHLDYFESQEQVSAQDLHGSGEMLFARKFSDETLHLVDRIETMIARKEKLIPVVVPTA